MELKQLKYFVAVVDCGTMSQAALGVQIDESARILFGGQPSKNLFAAGEVMAGNVLGKGYIAGIGMSIGTVFGLIAGASAAEELLGARV